ncbi:MAG: type VI secretion system ATPase TssH, partial [Saprospiraceae bacterium]|nr:type VI secretion system ATPase TssH [Saprospiraceae bacterium]
MTYDNFTIKAQDAIMKAQQIAAGVEQQSVDTPHLLKGILETDEHVAKFLLQKMGTNMPVLKREIDEAIKSYPKVQGSDKQYLTNDANQALSRAKKRLAEFGDEYISIELILLGILEGKDKGARILKEQGATVDGLISAIQELRKGRKVTDQSTEDSYNALAKYAI